MFLLGDLSTYTGQEYPENYGLHEKCVKFDACANVRYQGFIFLPCVREPGYEATYTYIQLI